MDACGWCGVTATRVETELGPYYVGHNTQRVCKRCGKRWCTKYPNESWDVVVSFCSRSCRSAWDRGSRRLCLVCDQPIPTKFRADKRTCSGKCRVALHRARLRLSSDESTSTRD